MVVLMSYVKVQNAQPIYTGCIQKKQLSRSRNKEDFFFNITNEIKKKTEKESFEPLQCSFLDLKI